MIAKQPLQRTALVFTGLALLYGCTSSPPRTDAQKEVLQTIPTTEISKVKPQGEDTTPPVPVAIFDKVMMESESKAPAPQRLRKEKVAGKAVANEILAGGIYGAPVDMSYLPREMQRESYTPVRENSFINTLNSPLSTFSIDVDTASYSNIRRFINNNSLPPVGAVRIEEMVNYFSYNYPEPKKGPFSITTELGPAPWQPDHRLVRVGIKARDLDSARLPPSNLVFLIDVSGSMTAPNKLPLLQKSMLMLVDQLSAKDRVAIVVYAGADRVVLPPTPATKKQEIITAINALTSGGSTHASCGIKTAYELAEQGFMPKGNNRVILASDGDFNVGVTSRGELQKLIEEKRESGVYLTVLGFGMGNYQDDTMEILADTGNGNYAYIDSLLEAKKVLIKERGSTLYALAKDVKIQVEFNPAKVGAYRLIGYENRLLADEDFNDDNKDAGEIGPGHRVTALYEVIPAGAATIPQVDSLKYQQARHPADQSDEILTVKVRYKPMGQENSVLLSHAAKDNKSSLANTSKDFHFIAAVAGFGMLLKDSVHKGSATFPMLLELARNGKGSDEEGYRAEFIRLLEMSEMLNRS